MSQQWPTEKQKRKPQGSPAGISGSARSHTHTHIEGANAKGRRRRRRRRFANELISHFEFKCRLQIGLLQSAAIKQSMGANCK